MDQDKLVSAIKAELDAIDNITKFSGPLFAVFFAMTLSRPTTWPILGATLPNAGFACFMIYCISIGVMYACMYKFQRIADFLVRLDHKHSRTAFTEMFLHPWMMNPFQLLPTAEGTSQCDNALSASESFRARCATAIFTLWSILVLGTPFALQMRIADRYSAVSDFGWWLFGFSLFLGFLFWAQIYRVRSHLDTNKEELFPSLTNKIMSEYADVKQQSKLHAIVGTLAIMMLTLLATSEYWDTVKSTNAMLESIHSRNDKVIADLQSLSDDMDGRQATFATDTDESTGADSDPLATDHTDKPADANANRHSIDSDANANRHSIDSDANVD